MKSRFVLALVAGLALCAWSMLSAAAGVPSTATGVYEGGGWVCGVDARLRPVGAQVFPTLPSAVPRADFQCTAPSGASYQWWTGYSAYGDCPQAAEGSGAWWGYVWPGSPPYTIAVGLATLRAYTDGSTPTLTLDVVLAPAQTATRITLTRTSAIAVPPAQSYSCGARKQDR